MRRPVRLALVGIAPVHYHAPLYRRLAADPRLDFTAIFASTAGVRPGRLGYGEPTVWDEDVLTGYRSVFLPSADRADASGRFLALRDLRVVRALARLDPDVLWSHGYYSAMHVAAAAAQRLRRRPVLLRDEQTLLDPRPPWKRAAKRALFAALYADGPTLHVGTENLHWLTANGADPERSVLTPYSVDNDLLARAADRLAPRRAELKRLWGLRVDRPVVLSVARLIPKKQPLALLEAFARVRAERPCSLLVVGSGELEPELRAVIERESIPDVVIAGFVNRSRIADAYAAADVFALPSAYAETWGLAVNEAMCFGLPVVVSDRVGCATDLVRDGENGFIVDATDVGALAARLGELVDAPPLARRLGAAGRARISEWTADAAADGVAAAVAAAVGAARWAAAEPTAGARLKAAA